MQSSVEAEMSVSANVINSKRREENHSRDFIAVKTPFRFRKFQTIKKPGPEDGPGKCWLVARIKLRRFAGVNEPRYAASGSLLPKS
jgi:hypothetical protein